ncbi:MAG: LamG domain-containing protein, partial [Candidatus Nealsonbacteria bacterium]|nr:LamG domain-containing protein [Candidatus Nealsonbacteria bacterium]
IPEDTMTRGLVGYWGFEEGSGSVAYDASNNGNDGTLNWMSTSTNAWTQGKVGGALQFDGADDYVGVDNESNFDFLTNSGNAFSMEFWGYMNALGGRIITKMNAYADGGIQITNSGYEGSNVEFGVGQNSTNVLGRESVGGSFPLNTWKHITVTYNGSGYAVANFKIYIDGAEASYATHASSNKITGSPATFNNSEPLRIGKRGAGAFTNGLIDEVRIYNRALSAEEVRYHYNRGGPVAEWKMNEGEGGGSGTVYDSTPNNNDGTLILGVSGNAATSSAWVQGKYGSALSFDGVDDYVQATVTQTKTTYSLWVKSSGVWEHVAKVNSAYYVNGVEGTPTSFPIYVSGNTVQIGKTDATTYFTGLIDDVRIYNYARTPDEIQLDYNQGLSAHFK